jgi:membrane-bound metal-dependent hydrolase YbcI (DUF457 family)
LPFSPFHLGPGAAFKVLLGERMSFVVFGGAQVLMDIEPLVHLVRRDPILHGVTHTLAGALAIGAAATLTGKPIGSWFLARLSFARPEISWAQAACGAFVGTLSHLPLDALMHSDMRPWWPLSDENALLHAVPLGTLHLACIALGALGALGVWMRSR